MRHSKEQGEIAGAVVEALAALSNPPKTAANPFYQSRYAPLNATLDLVRPVLAAHGLALMQSAESVDGHPAVVTRLVHTGGQWIESSPFALTPMKDDPQGHGGAITYARRYSLEALLGISGDEDDDGHYATQPDKPATRAPAKRAAKPPAKAAAKPTPGPGASPRVIDRTAEHTTFAGVQVRFLTAKGIGVADPSASDTKGEDDNLKAVLPLKAVVDKHSDVPVKGAIVTLCVGNWAIEGDATHEPKRFLMGLIDAADLAAGPDDHGDEPEQTPPAEDDDLGFVPF